MRNIDKIITRVDSKTILDVVDFFTARLIIIPSRSPPCYRKNTVFEISTDGNHSGFITCGYASL